MIESNINHPLYVNSQTHIFPCFDCFSWGQRQGGRDWSTVGTDQADWGSHHLRPGRRCGVAGAGPHQALQVWTLTQFYSVHFSQLRISVKSVFYERTIKVWVSVGCYLFDRVLGPQPQTGHTWMCPCFSVVLKATLEARQGPLKSAVSAQKAL